MRIFSKPSPPSVLIGGPVPVSLVVSRVEPPLNAFGNDGLEEIWEARRSKARGFKPAVIKNNSRTIGSSVEGSIVRLCFKYPPAPFLAKRRLLVAPAATISQQTISVSC